MRNTQHKADAQPPKKKSGRLHDLIGAIHRAEHKMVMRAAAAGHLCYYTLVSIEAHGNYRYAAAALGVLLLVEALIGTEWAK